MRAYELMYIVRPDLDEDAVAETMEKFNQLIAANQGEVESSSRWGKRRLAYEVKKFREGIYILVRFKGEPATEKELERILKISDEVIKFLIIRREE